MASRRWLLLLLLPLYLVVLVLAGTVGLMLLAGDTDGGIDIAGALRELGDLLTEAEWWGYGLGVAAIVTALQAVFLIPVFHRKPPREERSRSLTVSLLIGGALAGVLSLGLATALLELVAMLQPAWERALWTFPLLVLGAAWVGWSLLLFMFARNIWPDRALGRLVGWLFAGTAVEVIVVLPLDVMVRRRTDCYCGEGTFFSLVICAFATIWLTGPGIVIALTSRRHRRWRETHCAKCGYPMGRAGSTRCPECGTGARKGDGGDSNPRPPGPQPGALTN